MILWLIVSRLKARKRIKREEVKMGKFKFVANGGTRVLKCHCASDFQDKKYGKGKRLHNATVKGYRCTVCGQSKE